jgi:hypothetical protein
MRRWILRILLCLIVGAVTTVAVAWGCANLFGARYSVRLYTPHGFSDHNWPEQETQGWPLRALAEQIPPDDYPATVTVIKLENAKLALGPIWPGFLIDTLFYAAIWGGVFFGFASAKRAIRRRRGRCPRCGYDLRRDLAAGCSECGWNRAQPETERFRDGETKGAES